MPELDKECGRRIYEIAERIFPINRSITGNGVRKTLRILKEYLPELTIHEVPSGTEVFDWTVPQEWNCEEAYIENEAGERIIDFKECNLHVLGYSLPMDEWMDWEELKKIVYTQPDQEEVIPYVTSYYEGRSGFCMSEKQKRQLDEKGGRYHAVIKSSLTAGSLTYGECVIPGESEQEIFVSTYVCHPSMANNECSGPALSVYLANLVKTMHRRYTYRFVFIPETIGSITYLSKNYRYLQDHMLAGFLLSCVGDDRTYSMVETRYGDTITDRLLRNVLHYVSPGYCHYTFLDRGSDERQYNAPGIDLPVCTFCRSKYGEYPEYHTSADDLNLVSPAGFRGSLEVMCRCIEVLEHNDKYQISVFCEPMLSKRKLQSSISQKGNYAQVMRLRNFIAYADGKNDLLRIAERIGESVYDLLPIVEELKACELI
ncbi:MAG: DUF4910 domain-containing protein [Lachnospiraceae bacterium]|nr:DUF4910 domain-containing protein [Lachnospiraceae bacterium]